MADSSYTDLSVIVVDDVRAMRVILKTLLRNLGIQDVVEAGDGAEALKILGEHPRQLIITDLSMSPMNGIELTRQLRQPGCSHASVPVLMISGHNEKTRIAEAVSAGVSAFLLKPVTAKALEAKLHALIQNPIPVVRTDLYHGPERRRRSAWVRKERRSAILL